VMLLQCDFEINRLARNETKFTVDERRTDSSGDGSKHDKKISRVNVTRKEIARAAGSE